MDRLFVYGSLQPTGPNEHVLAQVSGEWQAATVKGRLVDRGWGARVGYPGLLLDDDGDDVSGYVLASTALPSMWKQLDEFEGIEYERITAAVTLALGERVQAYVYVLRSEQT